MWMKRIVSIGSCCLLAGCLAVPLAAQDEDNELGWFDSAELSLFMTSGNAKAESLALRNTLRRVWEDSSFELAAGALRGESTAISRLAMGTATQFEIVERSESAVTAENYFFRGRYDRTIAGNLFWFAGAGWERNEFAGIKNRAMLFGGVGNVWFDDEAAHFKTDYSLTYTDQEDVVANPAVDDAFFGLRFSWDYGRQLTASTEYKNLLIVDTNVDQSSDYRADMTNAVAVAMSSKMALQVSLQFLFDNEPALTELVLMTLVPPDAIEIGSVLAPLEDLDTLLTASLVVNF